MCGRLLEGQEARASLGGGLHHGRRLFMKSYTNNYNNYNNDSNNDNHHHHHDKQYVHIYIYIYTHILYIDIV